MASFITGNVPYLSSSHSSYTSLNKPSDTTVYKNESIGVIAPKNVLAQGSLQLATTDKKVSFQNWSEKDNEDSFTTLQAISSIWHEKKIADQYLVYGKDTTSSSEPFHWEIVPYKNASGSLSRFWNQLKVLWRITFGPAEETSTIHENKITLFSKELSTEAEALSQQVSKVEEAVKGSDAFCNMDVIQSQKVFEGKHIYVLYNYAPIGLGEEKLHFLFVPKNHRKNFKELSKEEYLEASKLTKLVLEHFNNTRQVRGAYVFHKTGLDAGQTVDHWHSHLIITTSPTEDFIGKVKVLWKMIFGASPLKGEALSTPVEKYKKEFENLSIV